jgi:glycosyltransferase involved in cell wall biosynthesis
MGILLKEFPNLIDEESARTLRSIDAGSRPDRHREHVSLPVPDYYALNGLLTGAALQGATRIFVHSGMAAMLARGNMPSDRRDRVAIVPFGHAIREVRDREKTDAVVSLGLVDRIKSSDLVCAAFITLAHKYPLLTFAIVGELWDKAFASELAELVRAAGLGDRLVLTGRVSSGTYERWLSRARVAVQLRARSNGETSAAIADCLGAGVPVIASNTGSMAEPEVVKLDEASGSDCQAAGSSFRGSLIQADAGSSRIFASWVVANLVGYCCRAASRVWERCRAVSPARP